MLRRVPLMLTLLFLLIGSSGARSTHSPVSSNKGPAAPREQRTMDILEEPDTSVYLWKADSVWVDSVFNHLTLREKIGQMIVPYTLASYMSGSDDTYEDLAHLVKDLHVGGFVVSTGNVYEQAMLLNRLQKISRIPLLFSSDYEFGLGMRLDGGISFPSNMALGATRDSSLTYSIGRAIGDESRAIGVLQNYAPVSDVNDNPENPIINVRSFGENPRLVGELAAGFLKGVQDAGVVATAKHFPGHGDTRIDSHSSLPTIDYNYARLDTMELVPFRDDVAAGVKAIMVAHIAFPRFQDETGVPATLSRKVTTGMLRDSLGFHGLVVTDALSMGGVMAEYSTAEAAIRAVNAGADILLMPPDEQIAVDAIERAVRQGEIAPSRIDDAVRKILSIKSELGLDKRRFVNVGEIDHVVGSENHELLAERAARRSITVVRNDRHIIPLQYHQDRQILCLTVGDDGDPEIGAQFRKELAQRCDNIEYAQLDPQSNALNFDEVNRMARWADIIIIASYVRWRSGQGTVDFPPQVDKFLNKLVSTRKPCVMISFGNPYLLRSVPSVPAYMCAYSAAKYCVSAAAEALFGEIDVTGKLPITISKSAPYGAGIDIPKTSLRFASPIEAGFDPSRLAGLDSIMHTWIADGAFPGAQLLVAKNGMIVYDKDFGTLDTSLFSRRVQSGTMYGIKSLTSVVATTLAAMKLHDEGRLNLDAPVVKYFPEFAANGSDSVTVRDLLVHDHGPSPDPTQYQSDTSAIQAKRHRRPLGDRTGFATTDSSREQIGASHKSIVDSAYPVPLQDESGARMVHADSSAIMVGKIIEKITGMTLDRFVKSNFYRPLGMTHTMFRPPSYLWKDCAATECDMAAGSRSHGVAHNENARSPGSVAGHTGLFSTSEDLAVYAQMLLNGGVYDGRSYLKASTISSFSGNLYGFPADALRRDTNAPVQSSPGDSASTLLRGHSGFTGTSIWIDPGRRLFVILLTNQACATQSRRKNSNLWPEVHNAVVGALLHDR